MIVALLLMALMQDGPVQTAPPASAVDFSSYAEVVRAREAQAAADPGTRCTFGGRPVSSPGCPTSDGRIDLTAPAASDQDANPWDALTEAGLAQATPGEGGYSRSAAAAGLGRLGFRRAPGADGEVPAWALDDPAGWEASQCGAAGDDACRRQARNRLAMARAGIVAETPASGGAASDGQNCRMVMRRSESGFGGSLSRVCGDEAAVQDLLGRLDVPAQPRPEPCDRPGSLETQAAWIARCQALPVR